MPQLLTLSDLYAPWPSAVSPAIEVGAQCVEQLAWDVGLLENESDLEYLRGFSRNAGQTYPQADEHSIVPCAHAIAWMFFFDDRYDEDADFAANETALHQFMESQMRVLETGQLGEDPSPLCNYSLHLRNALLREARGGEAWLARFCSSIHASIEGAKEVARWWTRGENPTIIDYLPIREQSSALYPALDLIEIAAGIWLSDEALANPEVQYLRRLCARIVALANDLFSFENEVVHHVSTSNLIQIVMNNEHSTFETAASRSIEIINSITREFETISSVTSAKHGEDTELSTYIKGMQHWVRGHIDWSLSSSRYRSPTSPFPELRDR